MPFRPDHDNFVRGILIYVQEDKPCKQLTKYNLPDDKLISENISWYY